MPKNKFSEKEKRKNTFGLELDSLKTPTYNGLWVQMNQVHLDWSHLDLVQFSTPLTSKLIQGQNYAPNL